MPVFCGFNPPKPPMVPVVAVSSDAVRADIVDRLGRVASAHRDLFLFHPRDVLSVVRIKGRLGGRPWNIVEEEVFFLEHTDANLVNRLVVSMVIVAVDKY